MDARTPLAGTNETYAARGRRRSRAAERRILISLVVAVAASLATVRIWSQLVADHYADIAHVAETASYGTRSALVRRLETQFSAFRRVALYWATYGGGASSAVPRLASDAKIELDHFEGVEFLAWRYPNRALRFFTQAKSPDLTHQPTAEEWLLVERALERIGDVDREAFVGPELDERGRIRYFFYAPVSLGEDRAELISSIDVAADLKALLLDEAPGYSIRVSCCDGVELYQRDQPAADVNKAWIRDGWIELSPGALWNVRHAPTQELADELHPWALDAVLIVGLLMSLLLGGFVHETLRATSRARAANAARVEVRAANAVLESQVKARTESLSEALGDINTINLSVAHDLRSPLQTISLAADALKAERDERTDSGAVELLNKIRANADYMGKFIDRLSSFSQISSLDYRAHVVDIQRIGRQVADELVRNEPFRADVEVGELPPCNGDDTMIRILLTNLIDNALKYAHEGVDGTRVELGHVLRDGETVYYVKDNGPGFDEADAGKLFEPLQRGSDKAEGLGLGLAIVKRIVTRHGGRVWAESSLGKGATFFFTLSPAPRAP